MDYRINQTEALFAALEDVAEYSLDIASGISEEYFFKHLYVPRKQEENIKKLIKLKNRLVLVVGARGTGKTTIARSLKKYWREKENAFVVYIDVRNDPGVSVISQMLATNAEQEAQGMIPNSNEIGNMRLAQRVLNVIAHRYQAFFPHFEQEDDKRTVTLGMNFLKAMDLIYRPRPIQQRDEMFLEFSQKIDRLQIHFMRTFKHFPSSEEFIEWVRKAWARDDLLFEKFFFPTYDALRVQHWVYLLKKVVGKKKQIIWIDNIDTLTTWQQTNIHSALRLLSIHVRENASVLVSVREQNVYKDYDYTEFGTPLFTKSIKLPIVTVGDSEYEAYEITPASEKEITQIFRKRLRFLLYQENKIRGNEIGLRKGEIEKLLKLAGRIREVLIKRKGILLTNGSVREFLKLNVEFMKFLLASDEQGEILFDSPVFGYRLRELTNLFMFFVRLHSWDIMQYNIGSEYDLISQSQHWSHGNETNVGHSINHLVLHAIWNLTLMNPGDVFQTHKCTTVGEVQKVLGYLNYSPAMVKKSIYDLYGGGSAAHSGLVEIQSRDIPHIETIEHFSKNDILNITMRGKVLVASIANTFSYTYISALTLKHSLSEDPSPLEPPKQFKTSNALSEMFPLLCDIAQMCIESLLRMKKEAVFFSGKNWFRKYLLYFGVPITKTYSLHHHLGKGIFIRGYRRDLQFRLMLNSIITYLNSLKNSDLEKEKWEKRVIHLRDVFNMVLEEAKEGQNVNPVDFRGYFKEYIS